MVGNVGKEKYNPCVNTRKEKSFSLYFESYILSPRVISSWPFVLC